MSKCWEIQNCQISVDDADVYFYGEATSRDHNWTHLFLTEVTDLLQKYILSDSLYNRHVLGGKHTDTNKQSWKYTENIKSHSKILLNLEENQLISL